MDIENLAKELILKNMTPEQQMAVLDSVRQSVANAKEVQKKKIGENVDLVVQALKKIESDIRDRFDAVGNTIEKRVASIQDGQDGKDGKDGRDGKDGKSGRDGLKGDKGVDGQAGRDGVDGVDGVSVVNANIDFDGSLIISLSDGREINVGEVVSADVAEKIKVISTMSTNAAIAVKEEGTTITSGVKSFNFVGTGITATTSGDDVTVTVAGGGGSGTVTSVSALTLGTSGTDLSSTVANSTTTPIITLNVPTASATNRGALSSTDWTTFNNKGSGTVTSVAATVPAFLSVAGSPITTTGTLAISLSGTALPVANGGTGQTSFTDGQLLIGNTTGNTLTKTTLTAGSGISITNGGGSISIAATNSGTVTSVTGTSPIASSGGATPAISLEANYGDTQNPYASKTAKFVLAAPNASAGAPTFRAIVASDIPTLNQSTTGSAATLTTTRAIYGNNFDGSAALTQIIASTYGGTGNGFTKFTGATTTERTYTLPDASSTIVVQGGALGTPSSGTVTNLTGTASININGTVGATTANTGAFTTLSATGVTTVQAGTAALPAITTTGDTNTGIFFPAADTIAFTEGGAEAMRIDSSGNFLVNTTSSAGSASTFKSTAGAGQQAVSFWNNATAGTRYFVTFGTEASYTERGFITWNGTTTALSNASDFRLKENIVNAPSALQKIADIQIRSFDFKEDGRHVEYGVIAQELIEVIPAAVFEGSDNADGSINKAWSVGLEPIIPVLVKALQEQQALITSLTARITALEAK